MEKTPDRQRQSTDTYADLSADEKQEREAIYAALSHEQLPAEQPMFSVELEQMPISIDGLMPNYRYRLHGADVHAGDEFLKDFREFLEVNEYLVEEEDRTQDFADGFARAAAAAALFLDVMTGVCAGADVHTQER